MKVLEVEDLKIHLYKDKLLKYKDYQYLKVEWSGKKYTFFRKSGTEWNGTEGILLDSERTYKRGVIRFSVVEGGVKSKIDYISKILGGGKWKSKSGKENILNLENYRTSDPLEVNKYLESKFLKLVKRHRLGFYYFTDTDLNYDLLNLKEEENKNKLNNIYYLLQDINQFKKYITEDLDYYTFLYSDTTLAIHLSQKDKCLDFLE